MTEHLNLVEDDPAATHPLLVLMELSRRARAAGSSEELAFMAVNDSHVFFPYRQAALWFAEGGIKALSGVIDPEANAPYAQWLELTCRFLHTTYRDATALGAIELCADLAGEWADWLPPHGLWLPFSQDKATGRAGALLLAADRPWPEEVVTLLKEWADIWGHAWFARTQAHPWSWPRLKRTLRRTLIAAQPDRPWWRQRRFLLIGAALATLFVPVRLSVLAPGELVPANPAVIRAPLDGAIGQFQVQPNQTVKAGQPLFSFDEAAIAARWEVAAQALATAQAEYRQYAQQAVSDPRSKAMLAALLGKIEEKRADADYFKSQLERSRVNAPQDGIVLFDDPSEWIGKAVQTGERIMRIATPGDVEVEAWLPIGDAIPLSEQAHVSLYLAANPLSTLSAQVRYVAHDAMSRPDGTYAYRVRARLDAPSNQRVGLKGTAKINGDWVPLIYWILRRPLATIRQTLGV